MIVAVDALLGSTIDASARDSLDGASDALTGSPASLSVADHLLAPRARQLVLLGYAAALTAAGAVPLRRRDVT